MIGEENINNPEYAIKSFIYQNNIKISEKFAIACSGGSDSMALVFAMKNIDLNNFISIICNHNIRQTSHKESQDVRNYLIKNNIDSQILNIQNINTTKNLENNARIARYEAIFEYCIINNIDNIFLGHHLNDNIETFLMRIERSTGLKGLCSIFPHSIFKVFYRKDNKIVDINLYRPFLSISKKDILQYLKLNQLKYWEDESNLDTKIKRNKIRHYLQTNVNRNLEYISETICNIQSEENLLNKIYNTKIQELLFINKHQINISDKIKMEDLINFDVQSINQILVNHNIQNIVIQKFNFCNQDFVIKIKVLNYIINLIIFIREIRVTIFNSEKNIILYQENGLRKSKIDNLINFIHNTQTIKKTKKVLQYSVNNINFNIINDFIIIDV